MKNLRVYIGEEFKTIKITDELYNDFGVNHEFNSMIWENPSTFTVTNKKDSKRFVISKSNNKGSKSISTDIKPKVNRVFHVKIGEKAAEMQKQYNKFSKKFNTKILKVYEKNVRKLSNPIIKLTRKSNEEEKITGVDCVVEIKERFNKI